MNRKVRFVLNTDIMLDKINVIICDTISKAIEQLSFATAANCSADAQNNKEDGVSTRCIFLRIHLSGNFCTFSAYNNRANRINGVN